MSELQIDGIIDTLAPGKMVHVCPNQQLYYFCSKVKKISKLFFKKSRCLYFLEF